MDDAFELRSSEFIFNMMDQIRNSSIDSDPRMNRFMNIKSDPEVPNITLRLLCWQHQFPKEPSHRRVCLVDRTGLAGELSPSNA